jgi:hypothetical protein
MRPRNRRLGFALARYDTAVSSTQRWNDSVTQDFGIAAELATIDGKARLLRGQAQDFYDFALARYNPNGNLGDLRHW